MTLSELKQYTADLFGKERLDACPEESGFTAGGREGIARIGYATNLTPETVQEAVRNEVDLILTHHDAWDFLHGVREHCYAALQEHGIGHAFFHAPLDAADFGTSACLARRMGARIVARSHLYLDLFYCGRVAEFHSPQECSQVKRLLQEVLQEPVRAWCHRERPIRRICVTAGGAFMTDHVKEAAERGCDAYVTGEKLLYTVQYARFAKIDLFVGSHTFTEIFGVESLAKKIRQQFPEPEIVRLVEEHME